MDATQPPLARLRLVAARYNELQGRRGVVVGTTFAIVAAAYLGVRIPGLPSWSVMVVALPVILVSEVT